MRKIFFVRHGNTDWSEENIIQGHIDVPLNERGLREAEEVKEKLKDKNIQTLFSSPLKRAHQTAEKIAEGLNLNIRMDDRLSELRQGRWEGKHVDELRTKDSLYKEWEKNPVKFSPPGGETLFDVYNRVQDFYKELVQPLSGNIVIVAHKVLIAVFYAFLALSDELEAKLLYAMEHLPDASQIIEIEE